MVILFRDYRERILKERYPHSKATIRLVQHCAAISATAELLCNYAYKYLLIMKFDVTTMVLDSVRFSVHSRGLHGSIFFRPARGLSTYTGPARCHSGKNKPGPALLERLKTSPARPGQFSAYLKYYFTSGVLLEESGKRQKLKLIRRIRT